VAIVAFSDKRLDASDARPNDRAKLQQIATEKRKIGKS
jgi:hypothetical protein